MTQENICSSPHACSPHRKWSSCRRSSTSSFGLPMPRHQPPHSNLATHCTAWRIFRTAECPAIYYMPKPLGLLGNRQVTTAPALRFLKQILRDRIVTSELPARPPMIDSNVLFHLSLLSVHVNQYRPRPPTSLQDIGGGRPVGDDDVDDFHLAFLRLYVRACSLRYNFRNRRYSP